MSTRRPASSVTSCTPLFCAAPIGSAASIVNAASNNRDRVNGGAVMLIVYLVPSFPCSQSLRIDFSSGHHLLRLLVEGYLQSGLDRGNIHAQRDGVAVSGFD